MSAAPKLKTWTTSQKEEDAMFEGHIQLWRCMVDNIQEKNLQAKTVLDFGCNQGGFLRMLYNLNPFKKALGVDIAAASAAKADALNPGLPITYGTPDLLDGLEGLFDVAFSHEVIYLIQDLDAHAKLMKRVLKDTGVYYAATGCHTENPLWPKWHKYISEYSNIPVPNYSLNDYAKAFQDNGFSVEAKSFRYDGFIRFTEDDKGYYANIMDKLNYYNQDKILFRFTKLA